VSDLLDICAATANWHQGRCAEVRVGDHVTRYVRRGTGTPPVIMLGPNARREPIWAPLVDALAASHRIVVPQPPDAETEYVGWLRGFIEGIGLSSVVLIAGGQSRPHALDLAAVDEFTVRKLVLVPSDDDDSGEQHELAERIRDVGSDRGLSVERGWSQADAVARITRFIAVEHAA
jgi:hypothetical protein